jgi:hypothetical protein
MSNDNEFVSAKVGCAYSMEAPAFSFVAFRRSLAVTLPCVVYPVKIRPIIADDGDDGGRRRGSERETRRVLGDWRVGQCPQEHTVATDMANLTWR